MPAESKEISITTVSSVTVWRISVEAEKTPGCGHCVPSEWEIVAEACHADGEPNDPSVEEFSKKLP